MDKALRASDELEKALQKRIESVYGDALKQAVKSCERFLRKIRDVDEGKIKPPAYYDTPEKVQKWRRGFTRELLRRENVVKNIEKAIQQAGVEVEPVMRETVANVYHVNRLYTAELVDQQAGVNLSYSVPTTAQAEIILKDSQPPMSKIAYQNLREAPAMMRRLQNEMTQAVMLGEDQKKLIHRIRNVMGNSAYCAKRIAQTERNRVQSQARSDTIHEAEQMGINMRKRWSTRMINSRESHIELNGKEIDASEKFHTILGSVMDYPGDPDGKAGDVINCHCVLVPVVLPPEEKRKESTENLENTGKHGIMKLDLQQFSNSKEKDLQRQKTASIRKSIQTFDKRIAEHQEKIRHPENTVSNWTDKEPQEQEGLKRHWKKEIENFKESRLRRIEELKKRGDYYE